AVRRRALRRALRPDQTATRHRSDDDPRGDPRPVACRRAHERARTARSVAASREQRGAGRRDALRHLHLRERRQPARWAAVRDRGRRLVHVDQDPHRGRDVQPHHAARDHRLRRAADAGAGRQPSRRDQGIRTAARAGSAQEEGELMKRALVILLVSLAALAVVAPSAWPTDASKKAGAGVIVLSGQGNDLDAYTGTSPFKHQTVIETRAKDPKGLDINAQICFFPDGKTFIAGEDTGQPNPLQGWGIFRLKGNKVGNLKAREIGKLQPTYQGATDNAENYGCGILSDGRVLTTDIGNQAAGPGDGQLIIWFPPFTAGFTTVPKGANGKV